MASILKPKYRTADATAPTTTDLADGEVAINHVSKTIYQRIGAAVVAVANYFTDAPIDGKTYGRKDGAWVAAGGGGGAGGNAPPTLQNAAYTLAASDVGKLLFKNNTTAYTYTVPASVFSAGDMVSICNDGASGNISIAQGSGMTLRLSGTTSTGTRTLLPRGMATIYFLSPTAAYVSGPGVG